MLLSATAPAAAAMTIRLPFFAAFVNLLLNTSPIALFFLSLFYFSILCILYNTYHNTFSPQRQVTDNLIKLHFKKRCAALQ